MKMLKFGLLGLSLTFGLSAFGVDFSTADDLFARRAEGDNDAQKFASATAAYNEYNSLYKSGTLNADETKHAVTQMGRLNIYRGAMLPEVSKSDRKDALKACVKTSKEEAKKTGLQDYHYFYIACLAASGKVASVLELPVLGGELILESREALEILKRASGNGTISGGVEGGGILRVLAGVYANPRAKNIPGLYDPQQSVTYALIAIETPVTGKLYFENYYYLVQAKLAIAMKNANMDMLTEVRQILVDQIKVINGLIGDDALPSGREAETLYYKQEMETIQGKISNCLQEGGQWNACLTKAKVLGE